MYGDPYPFWRKVCFWLKWLYLFSGQGSSTTNSSYQYASNLIQCKICNSQWPRRLRLALTSALHPHLRIRSRLCLMKAMCLLLAPSHLQAHCLMKAPPLQQFAVDELGLQRRLPPRFVLAIRLVPLSATLHSHQGSWSTNCLGLSLMLLALLLGLASSMDTIFRASFLVSTC